MPGLTEWYDRLFVDLTQPFKVRELLIGVMEHGFRSWLLKRDSCWTTCI